MKRERQLHLRCWRSREVDVLMGEQRRRVLFAVLETEEEKDGSFAISTKEFFILVVTPFICGRGGLPP